jgi:hypothetical protein
VSRGARRPRPGTDTPASLSPPDSGHTRPVQEALARRARASRAVGSRRWGDVWERAAETSAALQHWDYRPARGNPQAEEAGTELANATRGLLAALDHAWPGGTIAGGTPTT